MNETLDAMSPLMANLGPNPVQIPEPVPRPFLILLLAGAFALACIGWPVRVPMFLAAVLTVVSRPIYYRLTHILRGRARLAGGLMTLMLLIGIVVPCLSLTAGALHEMAGAMAWLLDSLGFADPNLATPPELLRRGLERLASLLHLSRDEMQNYINEGLRWAQHMAPSLISASVGAFGKTFLLLIAFYFFTVDGHWLTSFVGRISPLRASETHELLTEFRNVTSAAVLGNAVNALLQASVLLLGFIVTQIPHALFFGIVAVPAALVPLVGSQLVWGPAVALLVYQGRTGTGIGLALWCQIAVLVIDNIIKPWVLRGKVEFHPGLLLLGFIGGLAMFGLSGLVAGPLVVAFALTLFRIYQRDYLNRGILTTNAL